MTAPFQKLEQQIQSGKIPPVLMLVGEEHYGKNRVLALLKRSLVDPSMTDFNLEHYSADEISGAEAVDKASVMPMMADRRLLIVSECLKWQTKDYNAIDKYLKTPNESTCLVLEFENKSKGKKLFSKKSSDIQVVLFPKPKSWELPDYIVTLARELKVTIEPDAVRQMAELVGDDLPKIHRELDKLSLYKMGSGPITIADVDNLMGKTRLSTRWELNDYIGNRDLAGALTKSHEILAGPEDPIGLLSTISGFIKQIFSVKMLMSKGIRDKSEIGRHIGLFYPRLVEKLMTQQARYSNVELRIAFDLLRETDSKIKGSSLKPAYLIDRLLCDVIPPSRYSPPRRRR